MKEQTMLRRAYLLVCCFLLAIGLAGDVRAERAPDVNSHGRPPMSQWTARIQSLSPAKPTVDAPKRKVLVFSLFTGFKHDVIPYVNRVFDVLGKKSGAFDATVTEDIEDLLLTLPP
jgi:hypothetical protein